MAALAIFAHGKESGPWGGKIKYLAHVATLRGYRAVSVDYTDMLSADDRVRRLLETDFGEYDRLVLAGSSMGAYVSTLASKYLRPAGLFLLAPAFGLPGYNVQKPVPYAQQTAVVMGWQDDVIPLENVASFAREHSAEYHVFADGHRLLNVLPEIGGIFDRFLERILEQAV